VFVSGWQLSIVGSLQTVLYALLVLGASVFLFQERLTHSQMVGIVLSVTGAILINIVGEFVDPNTGTRSPIRRFAPLGIHRGVTGSIDAMPYWAGESVGGVMTVQPAAAIVR